MEEPVVLVQHQEIVGCNDDLAELGVIEARVERHFAPS
jgi:hypothetical protein